MRFAGRHRSLQQLTDVQIGKDCGLQARCTAKAHQPQSASWGCCSAVRLAYRLVSSRSAGCQPAWVPGHPLLHHACILVTSCT